ncbi:hypothetical protein HPB48_009580 [Haemaphysalis longicornis]|uniref:Peptidase M13 N-terminal domain-containing protein n=1 Tax=Haemaphysalis longicornis TaxID=44386 RepID=A0A9J6FBD2_HAELO|nr:hypothetical protein HPB48_009580 [Haemaphysalis longicornis]
MLLSHRRGWTPAADSGLAAYFFAALVVTTLFTEVDSRRGPRLAPQRWKTPLPRLCRSEACSRLVRLLLSAMNITAQPCVSFYDFACGGWLQTHSQTMAQYLQEAFMANVTQRLRSLQIPDAHQTPQEKAARYFTACNDIMSDSVDHLEDIKELLRKGGITWPGVRNNGDILNAMFYMAEVVRVPVLLHFSYNRRSPSRRIGIANTMAMFYVMNSRAREGAQSPFKNFLKTLYKAFSPNEAPDERRRFEALLDMESRLFESLNAALRSSDQAVTTTTDIHTWTRMLSKRRWQAVFYKYWRINNNDSVPVTVYSKDYFLAVFAHYRWLGATKAMDLYGWLCAQALFPFTNAKIVSSYYSFQDAEIQHRGLCFHQTDYIMHYAFQESFARDVTTESVRDDITRLVARLVRAVDDTITAGWLFFGACPAYANDRDRILSVLEKYDPAYVKEAYRSLPDMTDSPIANWMQTIEAAPSYIDQEVPTGKLISGESARVRESPIEPACLDIPWYALDAPLSVKLAGFGSRVTSAIFHELISNLNTCDTLEKNTERLWECVIRRERAGEFTALSKKDILVSIFSSSVLWSVLEGSLASGSTTLEGLRSLSEEQLFFVHRCLPLCGEDDGPAKCNLPLKDNVRFARAFHCRRGSPMRPKMACTPKGL